MNTSALPPCGLIARMLVCAALLLAPTGAQGADAALDPPTLRSLGVHWILGNATPATRITLEYRRAGDAWHAGAPLVRVEPKRHLNERGQSDLAVPDGATLFAGSVFELQADTPYEIRLRSNQPPAEQILKVRTLAEPVEPRTNLHLHVVPGDGGGRGTAKDPFKGLPAAIEAARAGQTILLHAGVYRGPFTITRSGEPGRPIIFKAAGDGEAILQAPPERTADGVPRSHLVNASDVHDVWFEGLTFKDGWSAIRAHESQRIVIRRCRISGCLCGVFASKNDSGRLSGFFVTDNLFEGYMPWPATQQQWHDLPESRAIWITGSQHVIAFNRIHHFKDGVDTCPSRRCDSIDIHNNDISQVFDDGVELDGSFRNVRCFDNRIVDCLCGISFQPICGGPAYAFRNVVYNIRNEPLKLHNSPSGAVIVHNTFIRNGMPVQVQTSDPVSHCYSRNNLFVGTAGRAADLSPPMRNCDFDYDGYAGFSGPIFLKFNERYATPEQVRRQAPVYRHIRAYEDPAALFARLRVPGDPLAVHDPAGLDFALAANSPARAAGEALAGYDRAATPALGAWEPGTPVPHYGPRRRP